MNCEDIIREYLKYLNGCFIVESTEGGCIIQTPYLSPDNDSIYIYITKHNDEYTISDQTQAMEYLFLQGVDIASKSRRSAYLGTILNGLNVGMHEDELYINTSLENIADGIFRIIEAIRSVQSLYLTKRSRSYMDFREEVAIWLDSYQIESYRKRTFIGVSQEPIVVDFVIPRTKIEKEPVFMYALHSENPGYAESISSKTIVAWLELKEAKIEFTSVCVLDDSVEKDVWIRPYSILSRRTDYVSFWENREELLDLFV